MYKPTFFTLLCLFAASNIYAAEWTLSGSANPSLAYDDNIFMRDGDVIGDYHAKITPTLQLAHTLENAETSLRVGYAMDRYEASRQLNTDNPFWNLNTTYQSARSHWGLGLNYTESTSRDDAADDTGNFETNSIVITESISPSYRYQLTERDVISVNGSYSTKEYSTTDFSNSRSRSVSSNWQHQFTERFNGGISLSASNNKSTGIANTTDDNTYNLSLTTKYNMSEIWAINGSAGYRLLDSQQTSPFGVTVENKDTGTSLDLNIAYKGDVTTASFSLSRSIYPSSTGDVNEQDKISLSWSRNLTETLAASINGSVQTTSSVSDNSSDKRDNINVSPSINWVFSPDASVSLSYTYRQQKESEAGTNASSQAVMLTINYDWDGFRASR